MGAPTIHGKSLKVLLKKMLMYMALSSVVTMERVLLFIVAFVKQRVGLLLRWMQTCRIRPTKYLNSIV